MTIALDGTPLTISTGGAARYTLELVRALATEFPDDQYWLVSDQNLPSLGSLPPNVQAGRPPTTSITRKWWLYGLGRELSRVRADVFHGTDFSVPYLPRYPAVMTFHDLSPWRSEEWKGSGEADSSRVRRRTPLLLRLGLAHMVITHSEAVRREAIARFRIDPDRIVAVPLAASDAFRRVECQPAVPPYFLFVGTLEPRKNVLALIEAWREVRKCCEVDLVLAGQVREGFPKPAPEPGLRLLGAVEEAELPRLYSGALACVYVSRYEGFGLPVLEAMQCGAIVVASRDPAVLEVSGEAAGRGAAIHVDATDPRALVEALTAIARAPENFEPVRSRALDRAREFSWRATARRTREVYDAARRVFKGR